ncbi:MAG: hypothetical protein ACRCUS_03825 [Anaerovoracaceae bacterium]
MFKMEIGINGSENNKGVIIDNKFSDVGLKPVVQGNMRTITGKSDVEFCMIWKTLMSLSDEKWFFETVEKCVWYDYDPNDQTDVAVEDVLQELKSEYLQ